MCRMHDVHAELRSGLSVARKEHYLCMCVNRCAAARPLPLPQGGGGAAGPACFGPRRALPRQAAPVHLCWKLTMNVLNAGSRGACLPQRARLKLALHCPPAAQIPSSQPAVKTLQGWQGRVHLDWPTIEDAGVEGMTIRFG